MMKKSKKRLYILLGVLILIVLWIIVALAINSKFILPYPWEVFGEMVALFTRAEFYSAVLSTTIRSIIGFIISGVLALALAVLAFVKPAVYTATSPLVTVLRAVPTMSIILLFYIWFSQSVTPVVVGFLITFPLLYEGFHNTLTSTDERLLEMSKVYGVGIKKQISSLYLPLCRNGMLSTMKSGISLNLKVVISAEVMANTVKSLGFYMQVAQYKTAIAELFAWTLVAVLLSFLLEGLIELVKYLTQPKRTRI